MFIIFDFENSTGYQRSARHSSLLNRAYVMISHIFLNYIQRNATCQMKRIHLFVSPTHKLKILTYLLTAIFFFLCFADRASQYIYLSN